MENAVWLEMLFSGVAEMGEEGRAVVGYLRSRGTQVRFTKISSSRH